MYTTFYGLDELPFELSPDPRYLLLTPRHREALANLQYGISARKSLTVLLGEAGTGKTTLVNSALASEPCRNARIVHLANPMLTREEFIEFLARSFHLSEEARRSKTTLLAELEVELGRRCDEGVTTALVIDEAQCLSRELLEEVRLLSNVETPGRKLLPLVLAGQPEFADRLNLPSLVQLKQRVALRCTLGLLDATETAGYVAGRLRIAGATREIFTHDAVAVIHQRSRGVPRTISVVCDNALVNGFALGRQTIDADIIREVCQDFDLGPTADRNGASRLAAQPQPAAVPIPAGAVPSPPEAEPGDRLFADFGRRRRFSFFRGIA